jgi:hypothetical protein
MYKDKGDVGSGTWEVGRGKREEGRGKVKVEAVRRKKIML